MLLRARGFASAVPWFDEIEQRIEDHVKPFQDELTRLVTIPGISHTNAVAIIAEIGVDPLVGILLMPHWTRLTVLGWLALAENAGMGLVLASDALSRDAAHWHAAEQLVAGGAEASDINAGLEWVGTHAELPARPDLPARDGSVTPRIMGMFPGSRECLVVSANPDLGLPMADQFEYRRWAVAGDGVLYVYQQNPCA